LCCCSWIKPCVCCICCWLLLLTILTAVLFAAINGLGRDVDDLQKGLVGDTGPPEGLSMTVTDLVIKKEPFTASSKEVLTKCPSQEYELIGCWVYINEETQWDLFETYTDLDPKGAPDCSCYCRHRLGVEEKGCHTAGAECRVQCAKFGTNWAQINGGSSTS